MSFLSSLFAKQLVGLDIGVSGIKAVELRGKKRPQLLAYNRVPLPWGAIGTDGEIRNREVVIEALRRLFADRAFSSKNVVVGASGKSVMVKKITVPKMTATELKHQLFFEAEQYLPFDVNEVNLDFAILGNTMQGNTPMMEVLLVAAKKDYVASLSALLEDAGLKPAVIDIQCFALGNSFEFNYGYLIKKGGKGTLSVILDIGAGGTKISAVEGDKTVFSREIRSGGNGCTLMISERFGISFIEAEKSKLSLENAEHTAVVKEYVHTLVEEIARTLDLIGGAAAVQGVYLCGGSARLEGLQLMLEERLAVPVENLNPVRNIHGSGRRMNAQAVRELTYLGAVAVGLSLRSPGESR